MAICAICDRTLVHFFWVFVRVLLWGILNVLIHLPEGAQPPHHPIHPMRRFNPPYHLNLRVRSYGTSAVPLGGASKVPRLLRNRPKFPRFDSSECHLQRGEILSVRYELSRRRNSLCPGYLISVRTVAVRIVAVRIETHR